MTINLEILDYAYLSAEQKVDNLHTKELVPKMIFRRRLTNASKLIIELMHQVNFTQGRIFYASAFGELPATANILQAINNKEMISPTDFQNSVYNTPVSYASILHKNQHEIMTISSGDDSADKLLKLGAIKALDGDTILLLASETLHIDNIEQVNHCIDYLETAVALKVRLSKEPSNITLISSDKKYPKSISKLIDLCDCIQECKNPILEVCI